MNKIGIKDIFMVAAMVLATLMISSLLRKSPPNVDAEMRKVEAEHFKQLRNLDSLLTVEKLKAKDLVIAALQQKDTVIIQKINSSNDRIKNIPATVRNLSNEDLRRAINDFR